MVTSSRRQFFAKRAAAQLARAPEDAHFGADAIVMGTVDLVTFRDQASGFTVFRIARVDDPTLRHRVVGTLDGITEGVSGRFYGRWATTGDGDEFRADGLERALPVTVDGCVSYIALNKTHFKGLGPKKAELLVRHFGAPDIFATLGANPERAAEVIKNPAEAEKVGAMFVKHWEEEQTYLQQAKIHSQGYTMAESKAIVRRFRDQALEVVLKTPYRVVEARGIGFPKADERARAMGVAVDDVARLNAGVLYASGLLRDKGHTGAPRDLLIATACDALKLEDRHRMAEVIDDAIARGALVDEHALLYDPTARELEQRLADRLVAGARAHHPLSPSDHAAVSRIVEQSDLNAKQTQALWNALTYGCSVLTGGPGTGKTTTTGVIVAAAKALRWDMQVLAPTGKAAQRAEQVTQSPATTLHRALGGYRRHPLADAKPLGRMKLLIVDETSMIGLANAEWLSTGIDWSATRVLLLGDVDQLESLEHGQVLQDILASQVIPTTTLTELYRQAKNSLIIKAAHAVNRRELPPLALPDGVKPREADYHFRDLTLDVIAEDGTYCGVAPEERSKLEQEKGVKVLIDAVQNFLVPLKGVNIALDAQILVPGHKSLLGTIHLNRVFQQIANPHGEAGPVIGHDYQLRVGDKVLVTTNTPDLKIYNGDLALVESVTPTSVVINLEPFGKANPARVELKGGQVRLLTPAWAMTIHKTQGSEFPYVLMAVQDGAHFPLLRKRLLFTGMTRAKKWLLLASTPKTLRMALSETLGDPLRHSALCARLIEGMATAEASHHDPVARARAARPPGIAAA